MRHALRSPVREYGVALCAVLAALLLTLVVRATLGPIYFPLLLAAVMFSAWYGGLGPGLLATALATLASGYILLPPSYSLNLNREALVQLATFVLAALFISSVSEAGHRAQAALRDQGERLRVTLASIGDAVIVSDAAGGVTFMNQIAEDLTGWGQADAHGRPLDQVFRIISEQEHRPVESPVARVLREGVVAGLANHTLLISRGGEEIPIDDSAAPIRDEQGQVAGVVLVFRAIAERRRAEEALRASEQRARALADAMPQAVWTARPTGEIDHYNQRWYDYTGATPEQTMGWGWQAALHPDDVQRCVDGWAESVRTGAPYEIEYRWRRADGTYRWHLGRALPVRGGDGRIVFWVGTGTDIDDQRRAADQQRFLVSAGTLLAGTLDYTTTMERMAQLAVPAVADWCTVDMLDEQGVLQLLAISHVDPDKARWARELRERYPIDLAAPAGAPQVLRTGRPEIYPEISDALLEAVAHDAEELRLLQAVGYRSAMVLPLQVRGRAIGALTLVATESGRRYGPEDLALAEELAARAAIAIDNAQLYREAQEAIRARDQFLSIASHELKTPLTSLMGYVDLLWRRASRDGSLAERDLRALRIAGEQAGRLNRLVGALLDLSRIESGQLSIERGALDLGALARRLVEEGQQMIDQHALAFDGTDEPLVVVGDELRLEQVLQNLIQNAIKYSPSGGQVSVRAERRDDTACVSVRDHGIGIPATALPRLFSRFYRAPNAEEQQISGMGIGLFVVKEIVHLHGGEITVDSHEGHGSLFTVCLPLASGLRDIPAAKERSR
ncbi:MAG: PAS domain S-box protein [Kouleothrix sp.]|nr:PAS domain S-box protein [Kouleothrix sp.]